jgi:hypothetical protein
MFTEEHPHLRPLPLDPFRYYQYGTRTVHLDGCAEVAGAYYAPPPGWLGREVAVQWDEQHVRLLDPISGLLLREHRRQARGRHAIHPADRSAGTPPPTLTLLARAARVGPAIGTLCAAIHRRDGEPGVRRILGVLALVKKHGAALVGAACATALELGVADYRFLRRYLERQAPAPLTLRQVDPKRCRPERGHPSLRARSQEHCRRASSGRTESSGNAPLQAGPGKNTIGDSN